MFPTPSAPAASVAGSEIPDVPIDHLDYGYIEKCDDAKELKTILEVLRSGKEGRWYDLEKACETKLISCLPPKEKRLYLAQITEPSFQDKSQAEQDVLSFLTTINKKDEELKRNKRANKEKNTNIDQNIFQDEDVENSRSNQTEINSPSYPPIRGQKVKVPISSKQPQNYEEISDAQVKELEAKKKTRISGYDWRAWEKYNVEEEEKKIDLQDEMQREQIREQAIVAEEKHEKRLKLLEQELKKLGLGSHDIESKSKAELEFLGNQEKQKGNECFKAGEFEESFIFFSRAIILNPGNAAYYSNRALSGIRLKRFEQAEQDCSTAIDIQPDNMKVYARRGVARHHRGKYIGAIEDFETALSANPNSKELSKLLAESRRMHREVGGIDAKATIREEPSFTRLQIVADDDDDDSDSDESQGADSGADVNDLAKPTQLHAAEVVSDQDDTNQAVSDSLTEDTNKIGSMKDSTEHSEPSPIETTPTQSTESSEKQRTPEDQVPAAKVSSTTWEDLKATGMTLCHNGEYESAVDVFQQAYLKVPKNDIQTKCICLGNQAVCFNMMKQHDKVVEVCTAVLEMDPSNVKALLRRSCSLEAMQSYSDALTDMCSVLRIDPDHDLASESISRLMGYLNNPDSTPSSLDSSNEDVKEVDKVVTTASGALSTDSGTASSVPASDKPRTAEKVKRPSIDELKESGNNSFKTGDYATALELYTQCLRKNPSDPRIIANRAMVYLKLKRFKEAVQDCSNGESLVEIEIDPTSKEYNTLMVKLLYRKSLAFELLEEFSCATSSLKKALALEPNNSAVVKALERIQCKLTPTEEVQHSSSSIGASSSKSIGKKVSTPAEIDNSKPTAEASKAVKALREKAKSVEQIPTSLRQFEHLWSVLDGDNEKQASLLLRMSAAQLKKVFRAEITDDIILSVSQVLHKNLVKTNPAKCLQVLSVFPECSCFNTAKMFMSKEGNDMLENIFGELKQVLPDDAKVEHTHRCYK